MERRREERKHGKVGKIERKTGEAKNTNVEGGKGIITEKERVSHLKRG